jgi:hypothetical protein
LFRAEFRAEAYRLQLLWTGRQVVDLIDSFQVDPEAVDERCLDGIQMAKLILEVEARVVLTKIHELIASTTSLPTGAFPGMGRVTAQTESVELGGACSAPREP